MMLNDIRMGLQLLMVPVKLNCYLMTHDLSKDICCNERHHPISFHQIYICFILFLL